MSQWICDQCDDNYGYCLLEGKGHNKPEECPYKVKTPKWESCND